MTRKLAAVLVMTTVTACAMQKSAPSAPASAPPSGGASAPVAPSMAEPAAASGAGAAPTATAAESGTDTVDKNAPAPPPPPATPDTAPKSTTAPKTAGPAGGKPPNIGAAQAAFDDARKTFVAAADCIHMCKALASMTNATDHLCELTQGSGEYKRCSDAKAKLDAAQAKVKSTCGGCT